MERGLKQKASTLSLFTESENITFDNITGEHNYRKCSFLNFFSYFFMLVGLVLQLLFLGSDIYTLIQIYALKNWDDFHTITYIPILAYKIVFTACIGISFIYVIFAWLLGIVIQRRNKVVASYLHTGARQIDSLKCYERFCIFEEIQSKNFHDWLCLSIYSAYHYEIISWLLADSPRQVLNGATIAYSISNKFTSNDISGVISFIAEHDKEEAVLLSFMFFSFIIWLCFTFKNVIIILSSICVIPTVKRNSKKPFNKYCADLVAESVSELYSEKAHLKEKELSKRRKVPSFMKNEDSFDTSSFVNDYNDTSLKENSVLNISNNDSLISVDASNPFDVPLSDIPASHSRVNLVQKSASTLRDNAFTADPFNEPSFGDDHRPYLAQASGSYGEYDNNNTIYKSSQNNSNFQLLTGKNHDQSVFMSSDMLENPRSHNHNTTKNELQISLPETWNKDAETPYHEHYSHELNNEHLHKPSNNHHIKFDQHGTGDEIARPLPRSETSNTLYESRGLDIINRNML